MKLHLGCGGVYLKGYLNIDFPLNKHTLLSKSVADVHTDILSLKYPLESIEEIRLHHVFEHFTRPIACALIVSWRLWLRIGGKLHIEVPDFDRTAWVILNPFAKTKIKSVALRHIFGSNEADWASHHEGWSPKRLANLLKMLQFEIEQINKGSWKGTYNFTVIAKKNNQFLTKKEAEETARKYLSNFLVGDSKSERNLLKTWVRIYKKQIKKSSHFKEQ